MIDVAVSCAQPPLLLPDVTGGVVAEVEALRSACRAAVQLLEGSEVVVVLGPAPETRRYDPALPGPQAYFSPVAGTPAPHEVLPVSLAIGLRMLTEAGTVELHGIAHGATPADCAAYGADLAARPERIGLLVMADGSARRGEKAPGHFDERSIAFDASVEQGLATGNPEPLRTLDPNLAEELLVIGRPAWQVLAGAFAGRRPKARLSYSEAPFGVWYPVATWQVTRD